MEEVSKNRSLVIFACLTSMRLNEWGRGSFVRGGVIIQVGTRELCAWGVIIQVGTREEECDWLTL